MKVTQEMIELVINELLTRKAAGIQENDLNRQNQAFKVIIPLDNERPVNNPLPVDFPFKSMMVESATDSTCYAFLRPTSREDHITSFRVGLKDGWNVDYHVPRAFLHWPAQPGKTMTIMFYVDSHFTSGSQLSVTSGGVSISDGEACETPDAVTLTANTVTIIAPAKSNRKCCIIENKTGNDLFIGDATVSSTGAKEGIIIRPSQSIEWRNTGSLYAVSVPGGKVSRLEEV